MYFYKTFYFVHSHILQHENVTAPIAPEIPQCAEVPDNIVPDRESSVEVEETTIKLNNLYNQISGSYQKETSSIFIDHCYSRPWNWRPESNFLRPTKTLFVTRPSVNKKKSINPLVPLQDSEGLLDVETITPENPPIYDEAKAKQLMEECEKHAKISKLDQENEDWDEGISK